MNGSGTRRESVIQDFCVEQENSSLFDMVVDETIRDFKSVEGMETAFSFQLFIDQRVTKEERALARERKGWIGDIESRGEGYQVGSILHLQTQNRDTQIDNNETAEYAKNALKYFTAIGAAKSVSATVVGKNIEGEIEIDSNDVNRYSRLWRATDAT